MCSLAAIAVARVSHTGDYSVLNVCYCELSTPQRLLYAVCEEALALLTSGNDPRRAIQRAGVKSYRLGSLAKHLPMSHCSRDVSKQGLISDEAKALMRPYIAGAVHPMITNYLNQTASWAIRTGKDGYGQPTYAAAATIRCRWEDRRQLVRNAEWRILVQSRLLLCGERPGERPVDLRG